jgi:hypothetical protein
MTPAGTVAPGTRFGPYEIVAPLGAGGMGEVYRAHDPRLGRDVALKVLPAEFTDDPDRRARFEREARAVAALKNPYILVLYDFGTEGSVPYAVMELLEGATLRERIKHGALPWRKAVEFAVAIADALGAAHARGIIHRDIKPENVFVTAEGRIKVLDFGLARIDVPTSHDEGTTQEFKPGPTQPGAVMGTAPYMSPEQLRGESVDARSDLFSFGCVLYEMLAGKRPFTGAYAELTAAILHAEPPELSEALPSELQRLVRRCLEKTPEARFQSARDLAFALQSLLTASGPVEPVAPAPPAPRGRPVAFALGALLLAALLFGLGMWVQQLRVSPASPSERARVWSPQFLFGDLTSAFGPRVSPDGQWVAFLVFREGRSQVAVMSLNGGEPRILTGKSDLGNPLSLSWSRDSQSIYFDRFINVPAGVFRMSPLKVADRPKRVLDAAESPQELSDGSLLVCRLATGGNHRLIWYRPAQEPPEQVVGPVVKFSPGWPQPVRALRDTNRVVFCGEVIDEKEKAAPKRRLYLLDLGAANPTPQPLYHHDFPIDFVQIALSPDDRFVYTVLPAGDGFQVVRFPLVNPDPTQPPEAVLTLTTPCYGLDVDREGRLYIDQLQRPLEVLRVALDKPGVPERIASTSRQLETGLLGPPLELPHDRGVLLASKSLGRSRLLAAAEGNLEVISTDDREEATVPAVLVGSQRLAYLTGPRGQRRIKLVEVEPDRVAPLRTLRFPADGLSSLAASPTGDKLYFVREGVVFEVDLTAGDTEEGLPQLVTQGDGVAVHPVTGELLLQRFEAEGVRLYRLPRRGAVEAPFPVKEKPLRLAAYPFGDRAIHKDGRVLIGVTSPDTWYWRAAVLSPEGELTPLPTTYDGEMFLPAWSRDGKTILAIGFPIRSELWRFTPPK